MMRGFSFSDTAIEDTAFNLLPQCVLVVNSAIVANTQSSSFFDFISQLSLVLAASMNYQNTINLGVCIFVSSISCKYVLIIYCLVISGMVQSLHGFDFQSFSVQ
jgi:hypothetical protein